MKLIYQTVKNCGGLINQFDSSLITLVTESAGVWSTVELGGSKVSPGLASQLPSMRLCQSSGCSHSRKLSN